MTSLRVLAAAVVLAFVRDASDGEGAPPQSKSDEPPGCLSTWYDVSIDGSDLVAGKQRVPLDEVRKAFAVPYRTGPIRAVVDPNEDPGRTRIEALFDATYGADAKTVEAALVPVKVGPLTLRVHRRIAPALARVAARLDAKERVLRKTGGTFVWRMIAGTRDRSAHSWGIAIDLDPALSDYWRNESRDPVEAPHWRNRIPQAVVDAFEAEGFIWGGRWYHYDTMHFEYRPELFAASCLARP